MVISSTGPSIVAFVRPTGVLLLAYFAPVLRSPYLCFNSFLYLEVYVHGDDASIS